MRTLALGRHARNGNRCPCKGAVALFDGASWLRICVFLFVLLADYRWVADGSVKSLLDDWQQTDSRMAGYRAAVDRLVECRWEA